jgi:hypothetical protein
LPDKYRVPIVLCDLEGKTRREAARQLGWPEGTVAGRLARARKMLSESLTRRGVVLSAGALGMELSRNAASASAPAALVGSTVKAASLFAAGNASAGAISSRVAALTEGVLQTMLLTKQKTVLVVFLVALLGLGGGALGWPTRAAENGLATQQSGAAKTGKKRDGDNLKNTLLALDKHLWEAASKGEWQEIEKFYAAEYLGVESVNKSDKPANVAAVKTHRPAEWKIRDVDVVRVSDDSAVLTYIYSCKVLSPEGRLLQTRENHRVSSVWAQRNGGWVVVYAHDEHGKHPQSTASFKADKDGFKVGVDFMFLNSIEYQVPIRTNDQIFMVAFVDSGTVEQNVDWIRLQEKAKANPDPRQVRDSGRNATKILSLPAERARSHCFNFLEIFSASRNARSKLAPRILWISSRVWPLFSNSCVMYG